MKSLLWLLCVISSLQCVAAEISLEVPGPGTVKPTETLEKTCKVSGASLTDSTNMYGVHWVRQPDGKGLEWLGVIWYDASTNYAESLQGRITITRDTNKGEVYVKLTGAKPDESGTYYCARHTQCNRWTEDMYKNWCI
ncbi:hypothetical protein GDO78_020648 [Eleutherodactylus coqui]|uniref:Ig-like domain-containing protein n=1 Tax=Eleutherodactylus coqui TaxID=57060 RepID=A0A8J6BB93_ELECQ|nr:hypothetical protein GDO78_020648 [Eleutherodactylus coqui]